MKMKDHPEVFPLILALIRLAGHNKGRHSEGEAIGLAPFREDQAKRYEQTLDEVNGLLVKLEAGSVTVEMMELGREGFEVVQKIYNAVGEASPILTAETKAFEQAVDTHDYVVGPYDNIAMRFHNTIFHPKGYG